MLTRELTFHHVVYVGMTNKLKPSTVFVVAVYAYVWGCVYEFVHPAVISRSAFSLFTVPPELPQLIL